MKELIGIGRTAEVFKYKNNQILKLYYKNIPETMALQEYKINKILSDTQLPIAKCYNLINEEERVGIIFEEIQGQSLMSLMSKRPWYIKSFAEKFAELHYSIHKRIDIELPCIKSQMKFNIDKTALLDVSQKEKIYNYIDTLPNDNILCHGDFHPDNILISKEKSYVIDWMTASKGSLFSDLARTSLLFKYGVLPDDIGKFSQIIIEFGRNKFLKAYLKKYIELSNISLDEIEKWELPHMASRLIEHVPVKEKELLIKEIKIKLSKI